MTIIILAALMAASALTSKPGRRLICWIWGHETPDPGCRWCPRCLDQVQR